MSSVAWVTYLGISICRATYQSTFLSYLPLWLRLNALAISIAVIRGVHICNTQCAKYLNSLEVRWTSCHPTITSKPPIAIWWVVVCVFPNISNWRINLKGMLHMLVSSTTRLYITITHTFEACLSLTRQPQEHAPIRFAIVALFTH